MEFHSGIAIREARRTDVATLSATGGFDDPIIPHPGEDRDA
jgi:hypothetical protein